MNIVNIFKLKLRNYIEKFFAVASASPNNTLRVNLNGWHALPLQEMKIEYLRQEMLHPESPHQFLR